MSGGRANHRSNRGVVTKESIHLTSEEGLMPDPETLEKLEQLIPNAGERWQRLAESEIIERQKRERAVISTYRFSVVFGAISALVATIVIASVGLYAIHLGHPVAGATIITGSMAQAIAAFLINRRSGQAQDKKTSTK